MSSTRLVRRQWFRLGLGLGLLALAGLSGCGYSIRPPYDRSIQTVHVPVFRSNSFRPDINLMLTEAVINEIPRRTPYRVVNSPEEADTILSGTILFTNKNVMVSSPELFPRHIFVDMTAEVTWEDIRPGTDRAEPAVVQVTENVSFYPEIGETALLGYQKITQKMAVDIVNMMEQAW